MAKHLLTALQVKNAKGAHKGGQKYHKDGQALFLQVSKTDSKSWVFRRLDKESGKTPEVGLGSYPEIGLGKAREIAGKMWELTGAGVKAKRARDIAKAQHVEDVHEEAGLPSPDAMTFDKASRLFIDAKIEPEARNAKHVSQWRNTIRDYASPVFGSLPVDEITTQHVLAAVQPIWMEKTETAKRVRQRIERVLDWATVMEYREGANPARWRGHFENLLPSPYKLIREKIQHHPSMPYSKLPSFLKKLGKKPGTGARALEFLIACAARSGEVRGCRWDEIDRKKAVWTIPAKRIKGGKEHRVPLSPTAIAILNALPQDGDIVFPAPRGGELSDMTLTKVMRDMKIENAVVHGFRSSFKDWARETTPYRDELSELALAHVNSDETRAAYARSDLFDLRRNLMEDWSNYLQVQSNT